ncbi:60S ribosomal protein L24, partial [Saguinus oedipus]
RHHEGRAVQFQLVQDLPQTQEALCQDRQEGFPVSYCKMRVGIPFQEESSADKLDCPLQKKAQKGTAQREQAIRAAKEAKKAKQASKKTAMAAAKATTKAAPKQKIVKPMKLSAPRVGGKR